MEIRIKAFNDGSEIPKKYTCDGDNVSPEIELNLDPGYYLLLMNDPDAPSGTFTHWIIYNIPGETKILKENIEKNADLGIIMQGDNDFGNPGYGGPCPPKGHGYHHYHFNLYKTEKIDKMLNPENVYDIINKIKPVAHYMGIYKRD